MQSFGWKKTARKRRNEIPAFSEEEAVDEADASTSDVDWLTATKRVRGGLLEDAAAKAQRLEREGLLLAEAGSFRQAVEKFRESLALFPCRPKLHEMMAQSLMELQEDFPAVQAAETAVKEDPLWPDGWRTLARAQRNFGEIQLALHSLARCARLQPWILKDEDFREELTDLMAAKRRLGVGVRERMVWKKPQAATLPLTSNQQKNSDPSSSLNRRKFLL